MPSQPARDVRRRWELRVLVALPAVWVLFAALQGYIAVQMTASAMAAPTAVMARLDETRLLVIGIGSLAALAVGALLAVAVTRPARELLQKIQHRLRGDAAQTFATSNELQQLSNAFDRMLLSFDAFVTDAQIVNGMPMAILVVDRQDAVVRANDEARRLFHAETTALERRPLIDLCPRGTSRRLSDALQAVRASATSAEIPAEILLGSNGESNGGTKDFIVALHPTTNVGEVVITIRDLTHVQTVRGQIQRVDQLAAVGAHVASLGHEIGGGLMGIQLLLDALEPRTPEDGQVYRKLQDELDRVTRLVEEIRTFGQARMHQRVRTDLGRLAEETVWLLESRFLEKQITLVRELVSEIPPLLVDRDRVVQAIINIATNAFDATPPGGTVTVRTRREAGATLLAIANTGSFIPPEQLEKIFIPFYTTKKRGTGLGLSLARRTLLDHHGDIHVTSSPESGTEFVLRFPDQAEAAAAPVSAARQAQSHADA